MKQIKIGDIGIPFDDYVTQGTAILGIRGAGKTYTAKGIAEQVLDAKIPIVVFDAIGVWRYLKTAGDGGRGYKVVVAGGHQPDLPLTPHSAPQIIRAAIRENIPLVVDLYDTKLSKADWRKIVQESFRILLYENTGLRHIFLEEAAEYCPQKVIDGAVFAEVEKLVRMGGNKSLGITLINQRSQELNKSVLELCDNLVMMRQKGFNAIAYAEKWAERLSPDQAREIGQRLPNMKAGECWVFTDATDAPTFTRSRPISSFHPDRKRPEHPKNSVVADPTDFVEKMSAKLATIIEEAKANDPSELRRQIAELKRKLAEAEKKSPAPEIKEVPALSESDKKMFASILNQIQEISVSAREGFDKFRHVATAIENLKPEGSKAVSIKTKLDAYAAPPAPTGFKHVQMLVKRHHPSVESNGALGKCERAILTALAQYPNGRSANQVAILSGYSVNSGGFNNALSTLRTHEYITRGQPMQITDAGLAALGDWQPLPTGEDLQRHWLNRLGKCERMILQALLSLPDHELDHGLTSEQIAEATGYSSNSGGFNNALSTLRTLELITRGQPIKASEEFFQ